MLKFTVSLFAVVVCLCGFISSTINPVYGTIANPIICEHYDQRNCSQNPEMCKPILEECKHSDQDKQKPELCYALWTTNNITGQPIIKMKGCFTDSFLCNQTECIDYNAELKNGLNFCCCNVDHCNAELKWEPTTTTKTETNLPGPTPEHNELTFYIVFCIVFVLAGILIVLIFLLKRKKSNMFNEIPTTEPEMTDSSACLAIRPIELIEMKARGRFGAVWCAKLRNDTVAVKIFPVQDKDSWASEHDIYKLPRMRHSNILEFIGAEKHTENLRTEFWLITAYHSNGSLCDYLKAYTVTWSQMCVIAETMAKGLMHLHEEIPASKADGLKPAIAHRDFKSKNVLLKNDLTACIADFGLALVFSPGKPCGDAHGQVGTRRYMAPEVLEGAINFNRDAFLRIDIYACGLVLWELVSRCTAHSGTVATYALPFEPELGVHPTLEEMQENVVIKKLRPKIEEVWRTHSGLNAICDTMEECWDHDAEARLSSSCVMERIAQHTRYPTTPILIETNTDTNLKVNDINDSV